MSVVYDVVTKPCMNCGTQGVVVLETEEQSTRINNRHATGESIQDIVPEMDPALREQIISGTHPECWDALVGPEF